MIIVARKISRDSVFRILFIGLGGTFFMLFLLLGIGALFGADTVSFDDEPVTGIKGLGVALLMWPVFSFLMSAFLWCACIFGLWLYSLFAPIKVEFKNVVSGAEKG